jgi:hypothetical protein
MANGGVSFGESLIFSSLKKVDYALSDDKKAFEIRFDTGLAAGVGTPVFEGLAKTRAPVSTRVYSAVIPATGEDVEVSLNVNGFGVTEAGTNTVLVLTANDQHIVTHFAAEKDEGFAAALPFRAKAVTEIRLTVVLIAERDSLHPDASALIAVTDIGADAALTPREPARPERPSPRRPRKPSA